MHPKTPRHETCTCSSFSNMQPTTTCDAISETRSKNYFYNLDSHVGVVCISEKKHSSPVFSWAEFVKANLCVCVCVCVNFTAAPPPPPLQIIFYVRFLCLMFKTSCFKLVFLNPKTRLQETKTRLQESSNVGSDTLHQNIRAHLQLRRRCPSLADGNFARQRPFGPGKIPPGSH